MVSLMFRSLVLIILLLGILADCNLPNYMLRPWPLLIPDQCLPGLLVICLALSLQSWVIQACICLPSLPVTVLNLGVILAVDALASRLPICHQDIKHCLEKWREDWPNTLYPQNNKPGIIGLKPTCVLCLIRKPNNIYWGLGMCQTLYPDCKCINVGTGWASYSY